MCPSPISVDVICGWIFRTFEIPVHIGSTAPSILTESYQISSTVPDSYGGLPPGFQPHQRFPYVGGNSPTIGPPPPPPPTSTNENHSILIQRVPHRHRKGRGK